MTTFTKDELYSAFAEAKAAFAAKVPKWLRVYVMRIISLGIEGGSPFSPLRAVIRVARVEIFRWEPLSAGGPDGCRLSLGKRRRTRAFAESTCDDCEDTASLAAFIEAVLCEELSILIELKEEPTPQLSLEQELKMRLDLLQYFQHDPYSKELVDEMNQILARHSNEIVRAEHDVIEEVVAAKVITSFPDQITIGFEGDQITVTLSNLVTSGDEVAKAVRRYPAAINCYAMSLQAAMNRIAAHQLSVGISPLTVPQPKP